MAVRPITIRSINTQRSNARIHTILQTDDSDILLIQEPWYKTIATLRSDTNPDGDPIRGAPTNPLWDLHTPTLKPTDECRVLTYTKSSARSIVQNRSTHPTACPNTIVTNIDDGDTITMRIINVYHQRPK
jgi:hypothetical protein